MTTDEIKENGEAIKHSAQSSNYTCRKCLNPSLDLNVIQRTVVDSHSKGCVGSNRKQTIGPDKNT